MNIVAIDPSLNNTAVVINGKQFAFVNRTVSTTKTGNLTKWFELASPYITYHHLSYNHLTDYSSSEVDKLEIFSETTSNIHDVVLENIDPKQEVKVYIEGYSYSSAAGPLIDLVAFGTLLRKRLHDITPYLNIISPTQLKVLAAKLTYPVIAKGKKTIKYEYRNKEGVAGGSFKKFEIYKALTENPALTSPWVEFLRTHQEELLSYKSIAKPMEDINDARILYESFKDE